VIKITFLVKTSWEHLVRHMKKRSQAELLHSLRQQLEHFDHSPDFGDAAAVEQIRRYLVIRIREAEGALQSEQFLRAAEAA
jgi:hypothetical protein